MDAAVFAHRPARSLLRRTPPCTGGCPAWPCPVIIDAIRADPVARVRVRQPDLDNTVVFAAPLPTRAATGPRHAARSTSAAEVGRSVRGRSGPRRHAVAAGGLR